MHCIFVLGVGNDVVQEEQVKNFWGPTFMKPKKTNLILFLSKGQHRYIPLPLEILLYNYP
jgi:hypothetical protein